MSNSCDPMDCSLPGHSVHGDSPGKNTGVGCHALLQGIFPTQGLNPGLPHYRRILFQLSHQGSPRIPEWVAYPFSSGSSWLRNWTRVSCIGGRFFTNWAISKRCLLHGRKAMANLDNILKNRDITLPTKVYIVKAMVFPVVMYGCESWTIKKADHRRLHAFELWCWRRS